MPNPIRPDLVGMTTLYYPIVEQDRFGSVAAMCKRHGWQREEIDQYTADAEINQSDLVVCDRLVMGGAGGAMCAVLLMNPGGSVILCCGLVAEATVDRAAAEAMAKEFAALPEFAGKFVGIGEFRGNPRGMPQ